MVARTGARQARQHCGGRELPPHRHLGTLRDPGARPRDRHGEHPPDLPGHRPSGATQLRNPRGTFQTGDIYDTGFEDNSFDVVVSFEVLEHLHQADRALAELARVAKEYVVLSVPHEPFFCLANAARGKNLDQTPKGSDPDHRNFWSRELFGQFVAQELDVVHLTGSLPWTICVGRVRR